MIAISTYILRHAATPTSWRNELQPVASTFVPVDCSKGAELMTFAVWLEYVRTNCREEEGQTMAEYGVVLAVIVLGIVATLVLLAGGINGALNAVTGQL